jgi:hypothetical protein
VGDGVEVELVFVVQAVADVFPVLPPSVVSINAP